MLTLPRLLPTPDCLRTNNGNFLTLSTKNTLFALSVVQEINNMRNATCFSANFPGVLNIFTLKKNI